MPFSLGIPKKATSPLIAFKERIWIASPGPTSTLPKDPSPRCSPTVATSTGAASGGAVVTGAAVTVGAAAAVVTGAAAGAASSAASEPQAPTISVNDKPSASRTRPFRRMANSPLFGNQMNDVTTVTSPRMGKPCLSRRKWQARTHKPQRMPTTSAVPPDPPPGTAPPRNPPESPRSKGRGTPCLPL